MATPTNHTASSLFDFGENLEPEPSQSSLEQNSSIEESNIFVSVGGEVSNHTRYSSSALGGNLGLKTKGPHIVDKNNDDSLGPLQEETDVSRRPPVVSTTATEKKIGGSNGILKPTSYQGPSQQQDLEQRPQLTIDPESRMIGDSTRLPPDFSGSHPPQPFSPTVHTSNQTPGFSGARSSQPFSPTMHTSNQTSRPLFNAPGYDRNKIDKMNLENNQEEPDIDQSAERVTAWVIHIALIFFCALIISCVILTFTVARNYSFLNLVLVSVVILFCAFLACFVDSTILSKNPKLRPVRQKILTVVRATRKIIEDEYHLFIQDWKESLLITEGDESCRENNADNVMDAHRNDGILGIPPNPQARRKKSKVFKLIRPFLGLKKNLSRRKGRWQRKKSATNSNIDSNDSPSDPTESYEPPVI